MAKEENGEIGHKNFSDLQKKRREGKQKQSENVFVTNDKKLRYSLHRNFMQTGKLLSRSHVQRI